MLYTALIFGLVGSFHCIGMCGPIAFLLPLDRDDKLKKGFQISLYHLGRMFSYGIIGGVFGLLGKGISLFGFQQNLSVFIGILMISVFFLPAFEKKLNRLSGGALKIVSKLKNSMGAELKKKRPDTFFTIGFLNGLLPCGLVYMAVLGATAIQGFWEGAVYMVLFGMGTVPLMSLMAWAGNSISVKLRNRMRKLVPFVVALMGVLFILRGLGLGIPFVSPREHNAKVEASASCHPDLTQNQKLTDIGENP